MMLRIMTHEHLAGLVLDRARTSPQHAAFRVRRSGAFVDVTWAEVLPRIEAIGAGLLTAAQLEDGANITIIGSTSMDWVLADFAALCVGLKTVPIYASLLPEEVGFMHADTGAQLVIAENAAQLEKVRIMRKGFTFFGKQYAADTLKIRGKVIVIDATGLAPADDWESLAAAEARGRDKLAELRPEMERRRSLLKRDQLATFTYTSGTTGPPKAVMQTHGNMLSMLETSERASVFDEEAKRRGLFLFLPLAHSFGRLVELAGPFFGGPLVISSVPTLAEDLVLSRPGFFPSAPRVYEKMMAKIQTALAASPPKRQKIAAWALDVGKEAAKLTTVGKPLPFGLKLKYAIADKLVLSKLRARLGLDHASVLLSGSAPLRYDVHEFFLAMGLKLVEAYGLTETCPGLTSNRPDNIRIGTVGQAFDCVELKIADDGEILARGPNITKGYLGREDATKEAFDEQGWFHTGDLGSLDADGFLRITGRKKELLKTSGGKYIAPIKIEALLKGLPIVQEAMVIGDNRNYCTVLFALDPEMLGEMAKREGIPADPQHERVRAELQKLVDKTNAGLASFESIKAFRVAPGPFTVDGGELTASLKVKRKAVLDKHGALVEAMYRGGGAEERAS
jgi:long-chain acyl-CoA synthetase